MEIRSTSSYRSERPAQALPKAAAHSRKTGDIREAFTFGSRRYLDDSFFSDPVTVPYQAGTIHSTRCRLGLSQFLNSIERGSSADILQAIVGNGSYSLSTYA